MELTHCMRSGAAISHEADALHATGRCDLAWSGRVACDRAVRYRMELTRCMRSAGAISREFDAMQITGRCDIAWIRRDAYHRRPAIDTWERRMNIRGL
jgi:hypothetical protein